MNKRIIHLFTLFLLMSIFFCKEYPSMGSESDTTNIEVRRIPGALPKLGFACELQSSPLIELFNTPDVLSDIKEINAYISLALIDLSPERAQAVKMLNNANIPVVAWLALPREQGYYMNASNFKESSARFDEFEKWSKEYELKWSGIGLDIEPNMSDFTSMKKSSKWRVVKMIIGRSMSLERSRNAKESRAQYSGLAQKIESKGYPVQSYQLSFIADERKVHSTLLDRILGIVQVKGTTEALMLYTSYAKNFGSSLIWSYGPESSLAIVVGVTGGGVDEQSNTVSGLNWQELSSDLIVASHFTSNIGIFSLEGCVSQGFLSKLKTFDWDQKVILSAEKLEKVKHFRKGIQIAIWLVTKLPYFIGAIVILIVWLFWRRSHKYKKTKPTTNESIFSKSKTTNLDD